jgi:hypothetical protein
VGARQLVGAGQTLGPAPGQDLGQVAEVDSRPDDPEREHERQAG